MNDTWLGGIPIKTSRFRIWVLRQVFRRRWYVQIGQRIYVLRTPWEQSTGDSPK